MMEVFIGIRYCRLVWEKSYPVKRKEWFKQLEKLGFEIRLWKKNIPEKVQNRSMWYHE